MNFSALIPPTYLRDYVKDQGWRFNQQMARDRRLYVMSNEKFPKRQLVFPVDSNVSDYSEAVQLVAEKLAELEKRSVRSVLNSLLEVAEDKISYRIATDRAEEEISLPLSFAASMVSGAEQMLLASACTVLKPQRHHPRLSRSEAQMFLDSAKFRHTQPGSFILNISCPVQAVDLQAPLSLGSVDTPFVRRATMTLSQGIQELVQAIEADSLDAYVETAKNGEKTIVSSNLCEAITRFANDALKNSVEISIAWAPISPRPANVPRVTSVRIQHDYFSRIEAVGRELRSTSQDLSDVFIGTVERLDGEMGSDGKRSGAVILSILTAEGEQVKAVANLTTEQYSDADRAHMNEGVFIMVAGTLRAGRQPRQLLDIESFSLVRKREASTP